MKYVIVIPAKNEEETLSKTLDSIAAQTIKPVMCVVVDDGSTDKTPEILKDYSEKYDFITSIRNNSSNKYVVGGHVVNVFYKGKDHADLKGVDYDFIIKLDADLTFDSNYMELIFKKIEGKEKIGIVSGTPYYIDNGKKIYEYSPKWHSHGQFKVYNKKCLEDIGGVIRLLGWDCADNVQAIEKGWHTEAYRDIYYQMYRKVGGKSSLKRGRIKHGMGAYNLGYSFPYLVMKLVHDLFKPPYIIGTFYYLHGYMKSFFIKHENKLTRNQKKILRKLYWQSFSERFKDRRFILFQLFSKK